MKKVYILTAVILAAVLLLIGCISAANAPETTRPTVTAPVPETLSPIENVTESGDTTDAEPGTVPPDTGTEPEETTDKVTEPPETQKETEPATTQRETEPATTAKETEPAETTPREVITGASASFLFCGDNLAHDAVNNNAKRYASGTGQTYNYLPIYDAVASYIKKADCAVINQESQIAGDASAIGGYPRFNTPAQMGEDLIALGFDVVSLANNHMLDNKTKGLKNCINYWKDKPVLTVGAYENKSDYDTIRTIKVNGITVAFLSYTEMINSDRRADDGYITPLLDESTVKKHVAAAKKVADVVIVMPHWGKEDSFSVTSNQKKFANLFAECGVDVVVGMHSHVAGKIEYIKRPDGGKMLCAYSLGNFVSTMEYARDLVGFMLSFDIAEENGAYVCKNVTVIPTVTYFTYTSSMKLEDRENLRLYLLSDFTDELAENHAYNHHEKDKIRVAGLKKYITDNVDREFLPAYLK
ncbi:MAG: CapA family protein [Clostridia bacterium]|nr:CapA family protein [Clostridia bacterium]